MAQINNHPIAPGVTYFCHPHHRSHHNPHKSQWTISRIDEVKCFSRANDNGWIVKTSGWGLHYSNNALSYLGVSTRRRPVFVARFVEGGANQPWHGYPADHQNNQQDRLPESLKRQWLDAQVLSPAKLRKLAKGEPCSL